MVPLCVDLDETLIRTDILWEMAVQFWRKPMIALNAALALVRHGKAAFKAELAAHFPLDPASLPYRNDVLEYIRAQREAGRVLVLATATHRVVAQRVADHLGIFSRVFATENEENLSGDRKRAALVAAFGERGFDYLGDHRKDLPIFASARKAMLVEPSPTLLREASEVSTVALVFSAKDSKPIVLARALRLHQWSKNVLLAVPLFAAHLGSSIQAWANVLTAFLVFGLVASATYLVNDLADLQADRRHARKRFRPLASGQLAIPSGILLACALAALGFALSVALLPSGFRIYLVAYVLLTLAYSFYLKRRLLVDVLALAVLYTLRILAGGVAVGVVVSEWLLMLSLFIFLSLAFLKRFIELVGSRDGAKVAGRSYSSVDLETVRVVGVTSGLVSVLVLSLYISNPAVSKLYNAPQILWFMCPLLIYWIVRIWFLAARGEVHHDPVVFALLDFRSYVVGALSAAILFLAAVGVEGLNVP